MLSRIRDNLGTIVRRYIVKMLNYLCFWGRTRTSFNHSASVISLPTKDGSSIPLSDVCKSVTPPCTLNPFLFNGHLQTIWTAISARDIHISYKRKLFEAEDPRYAGSFAVDFVVHESSAKEADLPDRTTFFTQTENAEYECGSLDTKPMLVTLHGLTGGSHEIYLREVLEPLVRNQNWEACVVNSRGCAMSKITTPVLFNARATWDVRQVVNWLREKFPNRPLFGLGFSLGANILTNVREVRSCLNLVVVK